LLFHLLGEASISANVLISMGNQCFYGYRGTDSGIVAIINNLFIIFGFYLSWIDYYHIHTNMVRID